MADPTGYDRDYSFSGFQANAPETPLPGQQVDIQLDKVSASITTIVDAIRDVRRPDGKLRNGIVTAESLSPGLALGVRPPAEWRAGVEYKAGDTVFVDVGFYRALVDHVSTDFAANLAAGLWELFADMSQVIANVDIQALLDKISNTRGAVLYRGASGWAALGAGTAGHVLTSGGAGADPSWQSAAAAVDALIPPEFVAGLTLSNNAGDPNNDIDIAPGRARGSGVAVEISSTITKRLDANWSEGDGEGGLDTGSKAANATYHVFVIRKDDDGTGDVLLSAFATSPTVPVGWTRVQRLGAILTDGSGNIRHFVQSGNRFMHNAPGGVEDYLSTSVRALSPLTVTVPDGVRVEGIFRCNITAADSDAGVILEVCDGSNPNVSNLIAISSSIGRKQLVTPIEQFTNTTRQVWLAVGWAPHPSEVCSMRTLGWIDYQIPRIG